MGTAWRRRCLLRLELTARSDGEMRCAYDRVMEGGFLYHCGNRTMCGEMNVHSQAAMEKRPVARAARLRAARDFVERNLYRSDLNPALAARALRISVRQLHMLFKPTGISFSRYVLERRLERARFVLETEPDRKVISIAVECGIESVSVFYRGFRELFGVNPTQHRRSLRQAGCARPQLTASDRYSDAALPAG